MTDKPERPTQPPRETRETHVQETRVIKTQFSEPAPFDGLIGGTQPVAANPPTPAPDAAPAPEPTTGSTSED